jgi:hypothetical protein
MPVHAFVDESRRGSRYLLATAIAEPTNLRLLRRDVRGLLLPGQRELHFKREKDYRRRQIAAAITGLPVEVRVYARSCERNEEPARQACLRYLARDLLDRGAHRLVIDSRDELDTNDELTIRTVVTGHPHRTRFVYEHVDSTSDPLPWVADMAAWCFGASGRWRKQLSPILASVTDLDQPRIARSPA